MSPTATHPAPADIAAAPAADPTPWTTTLDFDDCCRPNHPRFEEGVTDAQRAFLATHQLSFTDDSDDYDIRRLLETLQAFDAAEHPVVVDLIELIEDSLCPLDCTFCSEDLRDWLAGQFDHTIAMFAAAHPDLTWLVTEDGDAVSLDATPTWAHLTEKYASSSRSGYSQVEVSVLTDDVVAEVSFDNTTFRVHALTDATDQRLLERAQENAGHTDTFDVEPFLDADADLRALMWELYDRYGTVDLPEYLMVPDRYGNLIADRCYGTVGEAELPLVAALAASLGSLTGEQRTYALDLLAGSGSDWCATVAAVSAAVG